MKQTQFHTNLKTEPKVQQYFRIQLTEPQSKRMFAATENPSHLHMDLMRQAMENISHQFF